MKNRSSRWLLCFAGVLLTTSAYAHEFKLGSLDIYHPWARATVAGATNGAVFLKVSNEGKTADALLGASAPTLADKVEIHSHINDGGVMKMRPVDKVDVPAKGSAMLQPGGFHIMLLGLKKPLVEGEKLPLTLRFQQAGSVKVEVKVERLDLDSSNLHAAH